MRIINPACVAAFSGLARCEWCKRPAWGGTQAHHIHSRGAGQLDIRINLIGLCVECHHAVHNTGEITRFDLLAVVAVRERWNQDAIVAEVHRLRRCDKWGRERR